MQTAAAVVGSGQAVSPDGDPMSAKFCLHKQITAFQKPFTAVKVDVCIAVYLHAVCKNRS